MELTDWELARALRRQALKDHIDPSTARYLNLAAERLYEPPTLSRKGRKHGT